MRKKKSSTFAATDPTEILEAFIAIKDVRVLKYERRGPVTELVIEQKLLERPRCRDCQALAKVKDRPLVSYVDLPVYGQPMRLGWRKHRMMCPNPDCPISSWVLTDHRIGAVSSLLTTRAAKWATEQVGKGRPVSAVAAELGCDWHTINDAVTTYGSALLKADRRRLNRTTAIGLDETSFIHLDGHRTDYVTTVADVENHQIIDVLPSRKAEYVAKYLMEQPEAWRHRVKYGALDMSNTYAAVYNVALPKAAQVVDPFHVIQLANRVVDEIRRRLQQDNSGRPSRRANHPLYRIRRLLVMAQEKLSEKAEARRKAMLALGDPNGELAIAYLVKERMRELYRATTRTQAEAILTELIEICARPSMPEELKKFGRTMTKWFEKICNFIDARISNAPAEALNNLIKRTKRIGFGFRNFENYRIRVLLYAGKPNWEVLGSIVVQ